MRIEDRVRDALHADVETVQPGPEAWGRLQSRFRDAVPRHRRRRWPIAVAVATAVAVAGVAAAVIVDDDDTGPRVETPATVPPADHLAVVFQSGQVALLRADGGFETIVAEDTHLSGSGTPGATGVAADAQNVYYDVPTNDGCGQREIVRWSRAGGDVAEVAEGRAPAVSSDGRVLAFVAPSADCQTDRLVVRDLISGDEQSFESATPVSLHDPDWAPDGRRLALGLVDRTATPPTGDVVVLDATSASSLDDSVPLELGSAISPARFLDDDTLVTWIRRGGRDEIVTVDAASGDVTGTLFEFDVDQGLEWRVVDLAVDNDGSILASTIIDGEQVGVFRWSDAAGLVQLTSQPAWSIAVAPPGSSTPQTTLMPSTTVESPPTFCDERSDRPCVAILNGAQVPGVALALSNELLALGYTNQVPPGNTVIQSATTVQCRAGLEDEAPRLAAAVGEGAVIEGFPSVPPPDTEAADCIVILGADGPR